MSRRVVLTCILLFVVSEALFVVHLGYPAHENFDEFHYVKAARNLLFHVSNSNWEHPPLAKYLIAAGMKIWGDRPFGWRMMPTLFGSLTLVGIYLWARLLFRSDRAALWVAVVTLVNQFLFVTARIAMLDVFMFAFMLFGIIAVCALWDARSEREADRLLLFAGVMFALATACKWSAVAAWAFSLLLVFIVRLLQRGGSVLFRAPHPGPDEWYTPETFHSLRWSSLALRFVALPILLYLVTFVPLHWVPGPNQSWTGILRMQKDIIRGQASVVAFHPYSSFWWEWPVIRHPLWYAYDPDPADKTYARGVLLLGNPMVMWGGLLAVGICLWRWLRDRSRLAFFGFAWWAALYLCWAWVPRTLTFLYYYYPAAMTLGISLAYVFQHWERYRAVRWAQWIFLIASIVVFVGFYSLLADVRYPASLMPQ
jgi:dolichyl-phosphate-mannose--protein O-mannosyl transferase